MALAPLLRLATIKALKSATAVMWRPDRLTTLKLLPAELSSTSPVPPNPVKDAVPPVTSRTPPVCCIPAPPELIVTLPPAVTLAASVRPLTAPNCMVSAKFRGWSTVTVPEPLTTRLPPVPLIARLPRSVTCTDAAPEAVIRAAAKLLETRSSVMAPRLLFAVTVLPVIAPPVWVMDPWAVRSILPAPAATLPASVSAPMPVAVSAILPALLLMPPPDALTVMLLASTIVSEPVAPRISPKSLPPEASDTGTPAALNTVLPGATIWPADCVMLPLEAVSSRTPPLADTLWPSEMPLTPSSSTEPAVSVPVVASRLPLRSSIWPMPASMLPAGSDMGPPATSVRLLLVPLRVNELTVSELLSRRLMLPPVRATAVKSLPGRLRPMSPVPAFTVVTPPAMRAPADCTMFAFVLFRVSVPAAVTSSPKLMPLSAVIDTLPVPEVMEPSVVMEPAAAMFTLPLDTALLRLKAEALLWNCTSPLPAAPRLVSRLALLEMLLLLWFRSIVCSALAVRVLAISDPETFWRMSPAPVRTMAPPPALTVELTSTLSPPRSLLSPRKVIVPPLLVIGART